MGNEITELVAKTILNTSYSGDTRVVKREIEVALGDLLNQGKISREEFENAKNFVDDKLITALAAKNNVEFTMFSDYKELPPRMQEIMYKSCLTKTDLKELFQPYFNDYTINWVESLKTGKDSDIQTKGSITSHEFEDLVVSINEKIKNNNAGETLSKGEIKDLLKEFGFAINNRNERFYGDIEASIENGGLTNPTEAKMQQLKSVEEQALANEMYSEEQIVPTEAQKQETTSTTTQKVEETDVPQNAEVKIKENPYNDIFGKDAKLIEYKVGAGEYWTSILQAKYGVDIETAQKMTSQIKEKLYGNSTVGKQPATMVLPETWEFEGKVYVFDEGAIPQKTTTFSERIITE